MSSAKLNNTGSAILIVGVLVVFMLSLIFNLNIPWIACIFFGALIAWGLWHWMDINSDIQKESNELVFEKARTSITKLEAEISKLELERQKLGVEIMEMTSRVERRMDRREERKRKKRGY